MKHVTISVYDFKELPSNVREKVKQRYYYMCHPTEDFDDILQYDWEQSFGNTKMPKIQYDFSASQGSGVNLYTEDFDYIAYGTSKSLKTGFDFYDEASRILYENNFTLALSCNHYYTYSLLDSDLPEVLHEIVEEYPENCQAILKNFVLSLFADLKDFENLAWESGQEYFNDMSDEHYIGFMQDLYFLEDGTIFSRNDELN